MQIPQFSHESIQRVALAILLTHWASLMPDCFLSGTICSTDAAVPEMHQVLQYRVSEFSRVHNCAFSLLPILKNGIPQVMQIHNRLLLLLS